LLFETVMAGLGPAVHVFGSCKAELDSRLREDERRMAHASFSDAPRALIVSWPLRVSMNLAPSAAMS